MIEYRKLHTLKEFELIPEMEGEVWGFPPADVVPAQLSLVADFIGGQVIGAYDGSRMVGFCFALPGFRAGGNEIYLYSHLAAVTPEYRNRGIGRGLKLAQREDALSRNIGLIEWTFDPLELKNAYINIERLGVVIRKHIPNHYGVTTSKLHAGLPTDRLVAEWRLADPRTAAFIEGRRPKEKVRARVVVPVAIDEMRRSDRDSALKIQADIREQFTDYFARGLVVVGFERSPDTGAYLLGSAT